MRPWFDMVEDLQVQVFDKDTPSQRQRLIFGVGPSNRLKDDGRVLAMHGVVAESTVQLVSVREKVHVIGESTWKTEYLSHLINT